MGCSSLELCCPDGHVWLSTLALLSVLPCLLVFFGKNLCSSCSERLLASGDKDKALSAASLSLRGVAGVLGLLSWGLWTRVSVIAASVVSDVLLSAVESVWLWM